MVSENRALDAQLSAHCHAHRSCPSGAPPAWESQTATALDRCIASASLTMTQLGSHRALGRAARRRQQQQSDHPASVGAFRPASVGALGSARSRRVWELLAPTMDKAALSPEPLGIVYVVPKPVQTAPFQPSPHESVAVSVQSVPNVVSARPEKGLPPERVAPSEHESTQPTSPGYMPPDTVTADVRGAPNGGPTTGGGD